MARILIYTNHFSPENFKVNEIAEALNSEENQLTVITCIPNYPSGKIYPGYGFFTRTREKRGNMLIRRLPMIPRGSGSKLRIVLNYFTYFLSVLFYTFYISIAKKRFDVVFVHHTSPIFIAISPVIYKFFRRKSRLILWDLDIWPDTLKAVDAVKSEKVLSIIEKMVKAIYSKYDHILVGSKSFVKIVEERVKGVPVSYFPNWAEDVFTKRKITPLDPHPFIPSGLKIMFAGNMGEAQDIKTVFKAALALKNLPVSWLFVGDGRMRKWLETEVQENKMEDKFYFYGNHPIKAMPYFFSKADIMLVSLKDEEIFRKTVPAKLQAYLAFEKPILGVLSGEGAQIINESNCGWVSDSGNVEALQENVKRVINSSVEDLETKAKNGKNYFETHFKKELRLKQLQDLFK